MRRSIALIFAVVVLFGGAACERQKVVDRELSLDNLEAAGSTASGGWESAPFPTPGECERDDGGGSPWIMLGGRESLDIPHGLGRVPSQVLVYIAFEERGCWGTLASGDVARLGGVDATHVRLENGTTESFALRLYVE